MADEGDYDLYNNLDRTIPFDIESDDSELMGPPIQLPPTPKTSPGRGRPRKKSPSKPRKESAPPPPTTEEEFNEAKNEFDEELKRKALYEKLIKYKSSPVLGDILSDQKFTENSSYTKLLEIETILKSRLSQKFNRTMVDMMFIQGVRFSEKFMSNLLHVDVIDGFSDEVKNNVREFDVELEELSLEMGKHYTPSPTVRILAKLMVMGTNHIERKMEKRYKAGVPVDFDEVDMKDSNLTN